MIYCTFVTKLLAFIEKLNFNFNGNGTSLPQLNLAVILRGSSLIYTLSSNTIDISNVTINLVQITNTQGEIMLISSAESGEPIDISSLTRGTYILNVIADGTRYSRTFVYRITSTNLGNNTISPLPKRKFFYYKGVLYYEVSDGKRDDILGRNL